MLNDLRLALRGLLRQPTFTAVAVFTVALGIGASAATFSVVDRVILRPMPYPEGHRMRSVWMSAPPTMGGFMITPSLPLARRLASEARSSFDAFEFYEGESKVTDGATGAEEIQTVFARPSLFSLLGGKPRLGRTFDDNDMKPDAPRVAVISQKVWRSRYGGSRDVLTRDIRLDQDLYRIIGVMGTGFQTPRGREDAWIPLRSDPRQPDKSRRVSTIVLLKDGVGVPAATAELAALLPRMAAEDSLAARGFAPQVIEPAQFTNSLKRPTLILFGAVGLLLLIGCANVAALLLTRNSARSRELAIRKALGATRTRLIRLLFLEAILIAIAAGGLGSLFAMWGVESFTEVLPDNLTAIDSIRVDARVLGFSALVACLTGVLCGLLPAFQGTRQDLTEAMRGDARSGGTTAARSLTRRVLTGAQVAFAIVLLIGAGLMLRTFIQLQHVPLGFDATNTVAVSVNPPESRYATAAARQAFFDRLYDSVRAIPGVAMASRATLLPPAGGLAFGKIEIEGRPNAPEAPSTYSGSTVSHNYFDLMRIRVKEGRVFSAEDRKGSTPVLVINETMARALWPNESAIGKRLSLTSPKANWSTIVGIVEDVKSSGLRPSTSGKLDHSSYQIYQSDVQDGFEWGSIVMKTAVDPATVIPQVRSAVAAIDPLLPIVNLQTGEQRILELLRTEQFNLLLLSVFSGLGLVLAGIGIYGMMALYVTQRRHEIGVRMALGASSRAVVRLVLRQSLTTTVTGAVAGAAAATFLTRLMRSQLFEISPTDPLTFAGVIAVVLAVSVVSTLLPIRRAVRVDPAQSLRAQ